MADRPEEWWEELREKCREYYRGLSPEQKKARSAKGWSRIKAFRESPEGRAWLDETGRAHHRGMQLEYKYGITESQYQTMHDQQGGVCAICGRPETQVDSRLKTKRRLAVDHNHETKQVRGLLCGNCNKGIGLAREDTGVLRSMIAYLEHHERS